MNITLTTLVLSDSTIGYTTSKELRKHIDTKVDVIVNKHPGATAEEIGYYSMLPLDRNRPENVIIVAGSNDISREFQETRSVNEQNVVGNIIAIAKNAKHMGAKNVYVSSVLVRQGPHFKNIIKRTNSLLEQSCRHEGIHFLDHSDINYLHLNDDGLHCNNYGHAILKMNILCCFKSFNGNSCKFLNFYNKL